MTGDPAASGQGPLVSVVMATFRGAPHLEPAIRSVLAQTHAALELVVADDASGDGSAAFLHEMATADPRLVPVCLETNRGPAGARNAAIEAARGEWIAVVDSDDLIHPARLERLLAAARATGADMIADDMVYFGPPGTEGGTLLQGMEIDGSRCLSAAELIECDTGAAGRHSPGYLKPLIRRSRLGELRYDESLTIGEDFDLYYRLVLEGADFVVVPDPTYLYRRHAGSLSHRQSVEALEALLSAHRRAAEAARDLRPQDARLRAALGAREAALERAYRYEGLVQAIKRRDLRRGAGLLLRNPRLLADLGESLADRRRRRAGAALPEKEERGTAGCLVLAAPEVVDRVDAPGDALRLAVPPLQAPGDRPGDGHRALACRLAGLAAGTPPDVIAVGAEGLHALGYLPAWSSARLRLAPETARPGVLPPGVVLEDPAPL